MYIFYSILTYYMFTMILHSEFSIYKPSLINSNRKNCITNFFIFLISPDLYLATQKKSSIESKLKKVKLIKKWNNLNLWCGIVFFILNSVIFHFSNKDVEILKFLLAFFSFRTLSRSFEIGYAFFYDIIDSKKKNPYLKSNRRIILASKSYIEIIFNFANINLLAAFLYKENKSEFLKKVFSIFETEKEMITSWWEILLKSIGTTTLTDVTLNSFFSMVQVFVTLILVLFGLAGYLNNKGDNR
ncbi:MAG: hypothetical protein ACRCZI_01685 [Cetobacterium sp.]